MLTDEQASIVKGMLLRGDKQHDIAAYFGVNGGRIAEVENGTAYGEVRVAHATILPPVGPYNFEATRNVLVEVLHEVDRLRAKIAALLKE